jgi:hypothetical protein
VEFDVFVEDVGLEVEGRVDDLELRDVVFPVGVSERLGYVDDDSES